MHSALALAIGTVGAAAALFFVVVVLARNDMSFGFDRAEGRELLTYGGQLSGLYFGSYAANTLPAWVAGRTFGAPLLGLYSRANLIVGLPLTWLSSGATKVLFPLYGHVRDDIARTRALVSEGIILTTGFAWPLFAIVAGAASVVVDLLLGPRWHGATPLLQMSVLIACGALPTGLLTNAAEAMGWIRLATLRLVVFLALIGSAVAVSEFAGLGLVDLLAGIAIAQWVTYAITLKPFVSRGVVDLRLVLRGHYVHAAVSLGAFGAALAVADVLPGFGSLASVAGELGVTAVVCGLILTGRSWYPASEVFFRRLGRNIPFLNPIAKAAL
jgi:hypothetical protein